MTCLSNLQHSNLFACTAQDVCILVKLIRTLALLIHNAGGRLFAVTATNVASQQAFSSHDTASILFLCHWLELTNDIKKGM
jgi:hypothetical protein